MRDVEPNLRRATLGGLLREDAEEQQCLAVLLHAVPFDFTYRRRDSRGSLIATL